MDESKNRDGPCPIQESTSYMRCPNPDPSSSTTPSRVKVVVPESNSPLSSTFSLSASWDQMEGDYYTFTSSNVVEYNVHIKIGSLEGHETPLPVSTLANNPELRHVGSNTSANSDLYVTVQLWADSKPLTLPAQTAYKSFKNARIWNEWLQLPYAISDLPLNSQLAITLWDSSPSGKISFGGTTISLFDNDNFLQKGRQQCRIYRHKAADGFASTTTPAVGNPPNCQPRKSSPVPKFKTKDHEELYRLGGLLKKHDLGEIPRVDWLDALVFEKVGKTRAKVEAFDKISKKEEGFKSTEASKEQDQSSKASSSKADEEKTSKNETFSDEVFKLIIDFPRFDFPIIFADHEYTPPPISPYALQSSSNTGVDLKPPPEVQLGPGIKSSPDTDSDPDAPPLFTVYDPEVGHKDNPAESKHRRLVRNHRTGVLDRDLKPNAKIRDELNIIMSYGPTQELNGEEKDLVWKFRHHLTRDKRALTKFVKSVNWQDLNEARQAVSIFPKWTEIDVDDALELLGPTFANATVRAYAVDRLRKSDDEELLLYLLQLVQALKFEKISLEKGGSQAMDSSLATFLISRATKNFMLGNYLHWYLMVELDDKSPEQMKENHKFFARVEYNFMTQLMQEPGGPERRNQLKRQGELIVVLSKISKDIRYSREDRQKKVERLKKYLADPKNELTSFDPPLPLPLDPSVSIIGCYPDESVVFKSSLFPLLVHFKTSDSRKYPVIFKTGDDLRQDQLVIQIISLMDRLLRKENLDLKMSPYRILATGASAGAVQFVPSMSLAAASAKYKGGILAYLKANNPDDKAELGVRKEAMDTYVKSCAGYCVVTYLLGVGDRHLDNLLLAPDGHFFHADFGYILGRDPKPFPPPIKLSQAMIDGMGGSASANYAAFKQYCFTAYTTLRKSSNLILNLFALMTDANIPDIRAEPDKAVEKVRERFALGLSEEDAIRSFEALIEDSVGRVVPYLMDGIHDFMQRIKS